MRLAVALILLANVLFAQNLTDNRDGSSYRIVQLEGLYWMAENLRYDIEGSFCLEDCDKIRFYDYQVLKGVCPEGWRLPKMEDWEAFTKSFQGAEIARMMEGNTKLYRVDFLDRYDIFKQNILNIEPYGRIEGGALGTGRFIDFWTVNDATDDRFHMHLTPYSIMGHSHKHHLKKNKPEEYRLFPVRCVCEVDKVSD